MKYQNTPSDLARMLADRVDEVVPWLLPGAKKNGNHWKAGSVAGEKGDSLYVFRHYDAGTKPGYWQDANGADDHHGDLIDLILHAKSLPSLSEAIQEAKDFLGIRDAGDRIGGKPQRTFTRPSKPKTAASPGSVVGTYLTQVRRLNPRTITAYRVEEDKGQVLLPSYRGGDLIRAKWRDPENKKNMRLTPDAEPCLFGWQAIPPDAREVVITEGEYDAMASFQYGYPALSVPNGGGGGGKQSWIEYELDNLERFERIYLAMDRDDSGKAAENELITRLGRERCFVVDLPEKDMNDCLLAGVTKEEMDRLIRGARPQDPAELVDFEDYIEEIIAESKEAPHESGARTPWEQLDNFDGIRFRRGEVSVWTGMTGHGKTEALLFSALYSAAVEGEKFLVASMEVRRSDQFTRLATMGRGGYPPDDYKRRFASAIRGRLMHYDVLGNASIDKMLETFAYAARKYGVRNFIIDSLMKLEEVVPEDYRAQKMVVERIVNFAKEMQVHVHLVAHGKKTSDDRRKMDPTQIRGTSEIAELVDNVILVWRNKEKERGLKDPTIGIDQQQELERQGDTELHVLKQRATGQEPVLRLWFDPVSRNLHASRLRPGAHNALMGSPERFIENRRAVESL